MTESNTSSRRTVIITIAALLSLTTVTSLTYLYFKDTSRPSQSNRQFRALQKHLISQLARIEDDLDRLAEGDLRLTQVRIKTLRTYPCFPGDHHVQLPSLGLIQEEDKSKLAAEIQESQEELIRERDQGYEDPIKVRTAYHHLDLLMKSIRKRLLKLNARIEVLDLSELAELGDVASLAKESELQVFEKIRRRKRATAVRVQKALALLDHLGQGLKERTLLIKEYERLEKNGLEPTDEVEPTADYEMMKAGVSFAEVAALNVPEPEVLAPTEDLEKMKAGISFADMAKKNNDIEEGPTEVIEEDPAEVIEEDPAEVIEEDPAEVIEEDPAEVIEEDPAEVIEEDPAEVIEEDPAEVIEEDPAEVIEEVEPVDEREELTLTFVAETSPSRSSSSSSFMKMMNRKEEVKEQKEYKEEEVLAPTEDLELMKEGVTFAEMASLNIPEKEVLAPTEDLEKMKQGFTFANAVAEE
ncbi:hypothetical protein EMPS_03322 [Entomortierella parvispora]|uniref:Uncharacterized protein n=1 Tax=Entomortierella parvispora TaxID=205924 RepID=A0A9P3LUH1_9FUNG|nr:hypothetical protein EMPS_03322 [Entomortierella parvispora]